MKLLLILALLWPGFRPPTVWPTSLDQMYQLIETGQGNWVFTPCLETPTGPVIYFHEMRNWHNIDEDRLFATLILEGLMGRMLTCQPPDDRMIVYGPAVPDILAVVQER
jgi:hypothetical protein